MRILILGGTGEARRLAERLVVQGHAVTSSLAGRTTAPRLPSGDVRIGGFGGGEGLAAALHAGGFAMLVDATHPFAARISANAVMASARAGVPLVRLERPRWPRPEGADWIAVDDLAGAAAILPPGATALLTIGRQEVGTFFGRTDCRFVARMIEIPPGLPGDWTAISDAGPFDLEGETALMEMHGITHLVSKNSGGGQTAAKLEAAARLGIPTLMVRRPVLPPARTVARIEDVLALVAESG